MTTSDRVADPALSTMSGNMRHDSTRASCDGAGNGKPASNGPAPIVNGHNGNHSTSESQHGRQPSGGVEHTFQRPVGLTPYLAQQLGDNPNPISPGFNHPSAMPSPLAGPFPPTVPADVPSDGQLLTLFHVLHLHIDDAFRDFGVAQTGRNEKLLKDSETKNNELRSAMDEYFSDVRSNLDAIEHNLGRATGETENLKNALDAHNRTVEELAYKPMRKLTNQNTELIRKVDGLQERIVQLERKLENSGSAYAVASDNNRGHAASRPAVDGPPPVYARGWSGYDTPRHMVPAQVPAQQQHERQNTDVSGRYYNGAESSQHHNYQDSYYGNNSYGNYMRWVFF